MKRIARDISKKKKKEEEEHTKICSTTFNFDFYGCVYTDIT